MSILIYSLQMSNLLNQTKIRTLAYVFLSKYEPNFVCKYEIGLVYAYQSTMAGLQSMIIIILYFITPFLLFSIPVTMKTNDTHVNQGNSLRNTAVFVGRTDELRTLQG